MYLPITILLILIIVLILFFYIGLDILIKTNKNGSKFTVSFSILVLNRLKIIDYKYPSEDNLKYPPEDNKEFDFNKFKKEVLPYILDSKELLIDFLKDIFNKIDVKIIEFYLKLGLRDYVDTAEFIGLYWTIAAMINPLNEKINIHGDATFEEEVIDFNGNCHIKLRIIKIIRPLILLLSKKKIIRLIKAFINSGA